MDHLNASRRAVAPTCLMELIHIVKSECKCPTFSSRVSLPSSKVDFALSLVILFGGSIMVFYVWPVLRRMTGIIGYDPAYIFLCVVFLRIRQI